MGDINSIEDIEYLIDEKIKPLKEEIKYLKILLTTHIRDNLLLCEHCNESHYHTMYGNGEFRCNSCDNVSNIKI